MAQAEAISGSNSYKLVEELFKKSKELMIISPFISEEYANMLINYSSFKKIRIITSNNRSNKNILLKFDSNKRKFFRIKLGFFISILLAISTILRFWLVAIFLGIILIIYVLYLNSNKKNNLKVKIPNRFIHEKLYIGNDYAVVGSANLTYAGMHKNIEYMNIVDNPMELKKLKEHFNSLWYMFN